MLDKLLTKGKKYIFISNIDNLGATVDLNIVNLLSNPANGRPAPEFVMEVTDKTAADVKVPLIATSVLNFVNVCNLERLARIFFRSPK